MIDEIERLADAIETLPLALRQALVGIVQTFGQELLDINRGYLLKGERPDGAPIQESGYSPAYAAYRRKYGKQTAVVDLKFEGDFQKGFVLDYVGGLRFEIINTDSKAAKLLKTYGELYGIRETDIEDYIERYLLPEVEIFIRNYLPY